MNHRSENSAARKKEVALKTEKVEDFNTNEIVVSTGVMQ